MDNVWEEKERLVEQEVEQEECPGRLQLPSQEGLDVQLDVQDECLHSQLHTPRIIGLVSEQEEGPSRLREEIQEFGL